MTGLGRIEKRLSKVAEIKAERDNLKNAVAYFARGAT